MLIFKKKIRKYFPKKSTKAFIFGSSIDKNRKFFFDIDIGLKGKLDKKNIIKLQEEIEESNFPFIIDIVNFEKVNQDFQNIIFSQNILWL